MEASSTDMIVQALTRAIVDHRLQAGSKLAEQALADHFGVSRTLVRQALFHATDRALIDAHELWAYHHHEDNEAVDGHLNDD